MLSPWPAQTGARSGTGGRRARLCKAVRYSIGYSRRRVATALDPQVWSGVGLRPAPDFPPTTWTSSDVGDGGQGQSLARKVIRGIEGGEAGQ